MLSTLLNKTVLCKLDVKYEKKTDMNQSAILPHLSHTWRKHETKEKWLWISSKIKIIYYMLTVFLICE